MSFRDINPKDMSFPVFKAIGSDWMLVTAGDEGSFNTMTASWGGVGIMWQKPVVFSFIRPQRYTFNFIEKNEYFTLSFFDSDMKPVLTYCGSNSGREVDKIKETGLIPNFNEQAPYFEQAKMVLICRKMYGQFMTPESFIDPEIKTFYSQEDYHEMFIGEIVKMLIRE